MPTRSRVSCAHGRGRAWYARALAALRSLRRRAERIRASRARSERAVGVGEAACARPDQCRDERPRERWLPPGLRRFAARAGELARQDRQHREGEPVASSGGRSMTRVGRAPPRSCFPTRAGSPEQADRRDGGARAGRRCFGGTRERRRGGGASAPIHAVKVAEAPRSTASAVVRHVGARRATLAAAQVRTPAGAVRPISSGTGVVDSSQRSSSPVASSAPRSSAPVHAHRRRPRGRVPPPGRDPRVRLRARRPDRRAPR